MRYVDRQLKGTFGYIKKQTNFEIVKTLVLFAMAFGIFFIGLLTLHTKKSLWSVFAVLALLPACRSLVGLIMLLRFRSLSKEDFDLYESIFSQNRSVLYENIITTAERTYFVPVLCIRGSNAICFCNDNAQGCQSLQTHLNNVLKNAGHSATVKVFDQKEQFIKRARQIFEKTEETTSGEAAVLETIKAVSL